MGEPRMCVTWCNQRRNKIRNVSSQGSEFMLSLLATEREFICLEIFFFFIL